ncbi:hypothetical protein HMPREF9056_02986 [Actinomyces sp. oral taxon 170 str. F0386]|nr:hypothetical protein HMPREF9056_02986 [Actinomyces sp. oral taxon 170 str. F0386]
MMGLNVRMSPHPGTDVGLASGSVPRDHEGAGRTGGRRRQAASARM